jgi:hypothetical protein
MIRYRERNADDIIQDVEVDLTEINEQEREDLKLNVQKVSQIYKGIIRYEDGDDKLVYKTEVLTPRVAKGDRLNLLMVLGNPAIHSVQSDVFFAYEKRGSKRIEHRFWTALRDCEVLRFCEDVTNPTPDNIEYKRHCLLNGIYKSDFNISILPYFSFPTPSSGKNAGVTGIQPIVGKTIFAEMKRAEFGRFTKIVASNDVKNIICFNKTARKEILERTNSKKKDSIQNQPVYIINDVLKGVTLYYSGPTRHIHTQTGKKILKCVVSAILSQGVS